MLSQLADKVLPLPIKQSLLACCPTMDLIAVALQNRQVQVFRLNGQKVFGFERTQEHGDIVGLCWKPNGRALAIAYSSCAVVQISTHTGHMISQVYHDKTHDLTYLGWGVSFTDAHAAFSALEGKPKHHNNEQSSKISPGSLLDDALSKGMRDLDIELPLDLPADLGSIDVEISLPKLSILPAGGLDDDIFSSRGSLDSIFHTSKKDSNESVDALVVGFKDGAIQLSIYDTFEIGHFGDAMNVKGLEAVRRCSHPYTSTHVCLVADKASNPSSLYLLPMDLKMIPDMGNQLPLLASKSTQLKNLLRYMRQSIQQICTDFRTSQELPRKFMRNASEDLEEKEHTTLANATFHLAATGQCSPVLKEWLTDQLGDRGYRRWEKAATSGYEGVCRYTLQNFLPALDRFSIILSRFKGLSRFYDTSSLHGLDTAELEQMFDTLSSLRLMAHHILKLASAELRNFTAFAKWLKLEIEVQATDPMSTSVDEFPASFASLDYGSILDFIQGPMQHSELLPLCAALPSVLTSKDDSKLMYPEVKQLIAERAAASSMPSLASMMGRLSRQANQMFLGIASAQKRKVMFGKCIPLHKGEVGCYDITMAFDRLGASGNSCDIFTAVGAARTPRITVHKTTLQITNGMSTVVVSKVGFINLPPGFVVQDLRFADQRTLVVALVPLLTHKSSLLAYISYGGDDSRMHYDSAEAAEQEANTWDLSDPSALDVHIRHEFPGDSRWIPGQLDVNGRKDRRAVCVVERAGQRYKVFDLDSPPDGDDEDGSSKGEMMEVE